jgi:uncharacterized phage protein gp47/JayE
MSGLSDSGFDILSQSEIDDAILDSVEAAYGPINRNADGVIRQFVGIISERLALLWELAQATYLSYYPSSAEGVPLDNVAELTGITRIAAAKSTAVIGAEGTSSTVIPSGTKFSSSTTTDEFESDANVTITNSNAVREVLEITGVDNLALYRVTINSVNYDFTSDASATAQEIVTGLIAALASGSAPMTGVDDGNGTSFTLTANDGETGYNVTVSAGGSGAITVNEIWTPVAVTATVAKESLVNAGQIDTIVTPVVGMNQVEQFADGVQGRDVETDAELRIRITQVRLGLATADAIRSRLLNEVDGVSAVIVIENSTDAPVAGQPAHSVEVIIQGGDDQEIANKLWEVKPAGIETYGSTSKTVTDGSGNSQTVEFSRPTSQYAWVQVIYTKYDEESFPTDGEDAIETSVLEYGATFNIGQDLLWQRFLGPVFETNGVKSAEIKLAITATPGGSPSYVTDTDVAIAQDELAVFDAARVTVSEAP